MQKEDKFISIRCEGSSTADLDDLIPFQGDLKELTPKALRKLESVLIRHGFSEPVSVWQSDDKLFILNGHQRVTALKSLRSKGYDIPKIPIVRIEAADRKEAKEKVLALTAQYGALSPKSVSDFMIDAGLSLEFLEENIRFPEVDFDKISLGESQQSGSGSEDEIPEPMPTAFVKRGEVYILENHRLMCGDSTDSNDVAKLFNGEMASVWASDPPYGINHVEFANKKGQAKGYKPIANDELQDEALKDFIFQSIDVALPHMRKGFAFYMWHAMKMQAYFSQAAAAAAAAGIFFHRQIIWVKRQFVIGKGQYHWRHELCLMGWRQGDEPPFYGERNQSTVWEIGRENDKIHPTQKPVDIWKPSITNHTKVGEIIYEPFCGSGSNLIACEQTRRRCFAMELEPTYCGVILDRWQAFTGKKAHREDGVSWDSIKGA